jgi:hypothetical protein
MRRVLTASQKHVLVPAPSSFSDRHLSHLSYAHTSQPLSWASITGTLMTIAPAAQSALWVLEAPSSSGCETECSQ